MADCIVCVREYECDWEKIKNGKCEYYAPEYGYKEDDKNHGASKIQTV